MLQNTKKKQYLKVLLIPMKIVHLSHSDNSGGASRAAYRVHNMLIKNRVNSSMWVDIKKLQDETVFSLIQKLNNL